MQCVRTLTENAMQQLTCFQFTIQRLFFMIHKYQYSKVSLTIKKGLINHFFLLTLFVYSDI